MKQNSEKDIKICAEFFGQQKQTKQLRNGVKKKNAKKFKRSLSDFIGSSSLYSFIMMNIYG
jgi:hypothetical protein